MGCRKAPHPLACWAAVWPHGRFGRRRARPPARLGVLTSFGAAPRSPPVPSGPSGALHTCGVVVIDADRPARSPSAPRASLGASSRSPARPRHRPRAPQPGPAGLAAASNRAALGMTRPGPAGLVAASNRAALLMAPRVFRAPEGPAAREARRPHFVRRRASKPARALRTLRRPPHQWGPVADRCVVSLSGHAPPPPTGTAARPAASCGRHGGLAC